MWKELLQHTEFQVISKYRKFIKITRPNEWLHQPTKGIKNNCIPKLLEQSIFEENCGLHLVLLLAKHQTCMTVVSN